MKTTRRSFLKTGALAGTAALIGPTLRAGGPPGGRTAVDVADEPQLLLDNALFDEQHGFTRRLHPPTKRGLIKEADGRDWERGDVYPPAGSVVCRDRAGRFHMNCRYPWWDESVKNEHPNIGEDRAHWFRQTVGYAVSDDGIHWTRPVLRLVDGPTGFRKTDAFPYERPAGTSRENSLGYPIDFMHDLAAHGNLHDPQRRFLLRVVRMNGTHPFAQPVEKQMHYAADIPDVVGDPCWREKLTPVPQADLSPRGFKTLAGYDGAAREWFAVSQDSISNWLRRGGRDIARFSTPDLIRWGDAELCLPVADDEPRTPDDWVEYMNLDAYRVGGPRSGAWLGQLLIFHSDRTNPQYQAPGLDGVWRKGTTDVRLVLSRDAGRTWQRVCGRDVWLPHAAEPHGFDRLVFGTYPIRVRDEAWFYYLAYDGDHLIFNRDGTLFEPGFLRKGRTALATMRWDGYASLDAGDATARLVTRPLRFSGTRLTLNLAARRGAMRVELRDERGTPIPGASADDCVPIVGDGVALPVRWRGMTSLAPFEGKPVRLAFQWKLASFYGFQFTAPPA